VCGKGQNPSQINLDRLQRMQPFVVTNIWENPDTVSKQTQMMNQRQQELTV